jgi:hypothetical protein
MRAVAALAMGILVMGKVLWVRGGSIDRAIKNPASWRSGVSNLAI